MLAGPFASRTGRRAPMAAVLLLFAAACSPSVNAAPPIDPIVSPYVELNVAEVQVRTLPGNPPQIELIIHGTLPDMCDYRLIGLENRGEGSIQISLQGVH